MRVLPRAHLARICAALTRVRLRMRVRQQGLFEGAPRENLLPLLRLLRACVASAPGEEPTAPYRFITPLPPGAQPARRLSVAQMQQMHAGAAPAAAPSADAAAAAAVNPAAELRRGGWRSLWRSKAEGEGGA
jgi:hypothetical protein